MLYRPDRQAKSQEKARQGSKNNIEGPGLNSAKRKNRKRAVSLRSDYSNHAWIQYAKVWVLTCFCKDTYSNVS
jgi:hypothetical protein